MIIPKNMPTKVPAPKISIHMISLLEGLMAVARRSFRQVFGTTPDKKSHIRKNAIYRGENVIVAIQKTNQTEMHAKSYFL